MRYRAPDYCVRFRGAALLFLCLLIVLSWSVPAGAEKGETEFHELKAQYLTLRNTDVALTRSDEWNALAKRFEKFVDTHPKFSDAPSALLNASILVQILYQRFGGEDRVEKVIGLLERIARDYPGHPLVDDALIKRGDMLLYVLDKPQDAARAFQEVVDAYPDAELVDVARARLESIRTERYKQERAATGREEQKANTNAAAPLIVIDPGHGGEDLGAQGVAGLLEKDVALALSVELERLLTERLGAIVRLTRRKDTFVPLASRTQMANDFDADLFISIHVNASPSGKARGLEVYYLDNSGDQASRKLAERENASMQFEGVEGDLQFMLSDLIQSAKLDDSIILAHTLHRSIGDHISARWKDVRKLGVKKAPFYVLVGAHMPCVLLELFFINNDIDGPRLARKDFRSDLAEGIFLGIQDYLSQHGKIKR